jgi:DNA-directed RNA polymerase subunit RPC12/RpoP
MHAIPTLYKGRQFRSRLEARWAAMFDCLHWPFEYEPIELEGYIPDFIITFPHAPLLVEVKPAISQDDLLGHAPKILTSGWQKPAVVVGAMLWPSLTPDGVEMGTVFNLGPERRSTPAMLYRCGMCGEAAPMFFDYEEGDETPDVRCARCGKFTSMEECDAEAAWLHAGNITQWRGIAAEKDTTGRDIVKRIQANDPDEKWAHYCATNDTAGLRSMLRPHTTDERIIRQIVGEIQEIHRGIFRRRA